MKSGSAYQLSDSRLFRPHEECDAFPKIVPKWEFQKFWNLCVDPFSLYVISGHIQPIIYAKKPVNRTVFHVRRKNFQDGADWVGDSFIPFCKNDNVVGNSSKINDDDLIHTDIFSQRGDAMFENWEDDTVKQSVRYR